MQVAENRVLKPASTVCPVKLSGSQESEVVQPEFEVGFVWDASVMGVGLTHCATVPVLH